MAIPSIPLFLESGSFSIPGNQPGPSRRIRRLPCRKRQALRGEQPADGTLVRQEGLEPPTHGLEGRCSIRLSYWRSCDLGSCGGPRNPPILGPGLAKGKWALEEDGHGMPLPGTSMGQGTTISRCCPAMGDLTWV